MTEVRIQPAVMADMPEILEIRYDAVDKAVRAVYSPRELKVYLQDVDLEQIRGMIAGGRFFKACDGAGRILGCGGWEKQRLKHFHVRPEWHGQGIGRQLVEHTEQHFLAHSGHTALGAGVMPNAGPFYQKVGYTFVAERIDWDGSRYLWFEKALSAPHCEQV